MHFLTPGPLLSSSKSAMTDWVFLTSLSLWTDFLRTLVCSTYINRFQGLGCECLWLGHNSAHHTVKNLERCENKDIISLSQNRGLGRRKEVHPCLKLPKQLPRKAQCPQKPLNILLQSTETLSSIEEKHSIKLIAFCTLLPLLPHVGRGSCQFSDLVES